MAEFTPVVTAEEIAAETGSTIWTVRRWFRRGVLRGRKIGHHGWTTTRSEFDRWRERQPNLARFDLTAEEIAREVGVSVITVRQWFAHGGAPGEKVRGPNERTPSWRTTRAEFYAWYATYLTGAA